MKIILCLIALLIGNHFSLPITEAQTPDSKDKIQKQKKQRKGRRGRQNRFGGLKVGDFAPNFQLKSMDGKSETKLSEFRGKKPVVLFFGSYT